MFLAIDRFKVINGRLGQDAGDRFIDAFAALLREATEIPSAIARFLTFITVGDPAVV